MKDWGLLLVLAIIFIIIIFFLFLKKVKSDFNRTSTHSDVNLYDLKNDSAYRKGVYTQVSINFKPYIQKLYQSIDELNAKAKHYSNQINQAQYNSMISILGEADSIERQIRDYWSSSKFNKDFMYYIGLHYASHLLAGAIKAEQQNIKQVFISCKKEQDRWGQKIETAKKQQERSLGEQRRKLSAEIGEMCKIHKNISVLKGEIGAINSKYNYRVSQQNIETAARRDYIGANFGNRGKKWRDRIMSKHQKFSTSQEN